MRKCAGCNELHLMTLKAIDHVPQKDGNVQRNETKIVENMLIDAESYGLLGQLAPAPAPAAASDESLSDASETESETEVGQ